MTDRYTKVRTISPTQIAVEMDWDPHTIKKRLRYLNWLVAPFRTGPFRYNADVIRALQTLYDQVPYSTREDRNFLARYRKDKEIP